MERRIHRLKKEMTTRGEGAYANLRGRGGGEGGGADLLRVLNACKLPSVLFIGSPAHTEIFVVEVLS